MSSTSSIPHVRRTCGYLLSKQLLRAEGVRGFCAAVFGDTENVDEIQLEKLQHIANVLSTPPSGMKAEVGCLFLSPIITDVWWKGVFLCNSSSRFPTAEGREPPSLQARSCLRLVPDVGSK